MVAPLKAASSKYRNSLEAGVGKQLEDLGFNFKYEPIKLPVAFPPRTGRYTPDFVDENIKVCIETKGRFFDSAADRQKLILVRDQHPDWEFWLLFQNPNNKIYKGSKTTYAAWADEKGFKWAGGKQIPPEWDAEIRRRSKPKETKSLTSKKEGKRCRSINSSRK